MLDVTQRELIETIKHLEQADQLSATETSVVVDHQLPFEDRLYQRAEQLSVPLGLKARLAAMWKYLRTATVLGSVFMFVLGVLAAGQAFSTAGNGGQVNFFWLLVVLLGVNCLALLFWTVSLLWPSRGRRLTAVAQFMQTLGGWLNRHSPQPVELITRSWFKSNALGATGFWRFSVFSHGFWLAYLLGGLACIVVMLMARQFSFVWETTLLGQESFASATHFLSWLPAKVGFAVPDADAIALSERGVSQGVEQAEILRRQWASLLLGAVLIYGCALRLMLWLVSLLMLGIAEKRTKLPLNQPYYVHLRHQFTVAEQKLGIVDSDIESTPDRQPRASIAPRKLAVPAQLVAVELDDNLLWPPALCEGDQLVGHANDRQSQKAVLDAVGNSSLPLLVVADFWRTADRGTARYLGQLKSVAKSGTQLILLSQFPLDLSEPEGDAAQKLYGWHALALQLGLAEEQVIPVMVDTSWRIEAQAHEG